MKPAGSTSYRFEPAVFFSFVHRCAIVWELTFPIFKTTFFFGGDDDELIFIDKTKTTAKTHLSEDVDDDDDEKSKDLIGPDSE